MKKRMIVLAVIFLVVISTSALTEGVLADHPGPGGVWLYEHDNYNGALGGPYIGSFSSMPSLGLTSFTVSRGYTLQLFYEPSMYGLIGIWNRSCPNIGATWNDKARSMRVRYGVTFYYGKYYDSPCTRNGLGPGEYNWGDLYNLVGYEDNTTASVSIPYGWYVVLYANNGHNENDEKVCLTQLDDNSADLSRVNMAYKVTSVKIGLSW